MVSSHVPERPPKCADPIETVRSRILAAPTSVTLDPDDEEDDLAIFGDDTFDDPSSKTVIASVSSSKDPQPAQTPPPPKSPPPALPKGVPTGPTIWRTLTLYPRPRRWALFPTQLFDSDRLTVYKEARPLPLGF